MLVLTRKPGQSIVLTTEHGERITVHVIGKRRGRDGLHIGFDAPRSTKVLRRELMKDDGEEDEGESEY
jgi:carbon storage regulator CsrA